MKKTFKILSLIMVFAFLFLSASCAEKDEGVAPKDFSSNGMTITLTKSCKTSKKGPLPAKRSFYLSCLGSLHV